MRENKKGWCFLDFSALKNTKKFRLKLMNFEKIQNRGLRDVKKIFLKKTFFIATVTK